VSHYMPLVSSDVLDPAVQPHPVDLASDTPAWAHFTGRPGMTHEEVAYAMPAVKFRGPTVYAQL
jgi:hypothetical protein